ncbi:acyltransferase family protein [Spirosoma aerophilum]
MKQQTAYLTTLTPLRGIAALLVVIFHSGLQLAPLASPTITHLLENGWIWVDFFFVLSGFVLSHVYGDAFHSAVNWDQYKRYISARFARVYPLHFVTLCIVAVLVLIIHAKADGMTDFSKTIFGLHTIPASLLLLQSMHLYETPPLNTPSWSLSTEWWVYVIFPFLAGPFFNLKGLGKGIALVGIAALFFGLMYYIVPHYGNRSFVKPGELGPPTLNVTADLGYFRCLAGFLLGMLAYEAYRSRWAFGLLHNGWVFLAAFGGAVFALHVNAHQLLVITLFPLIILTAAYNNDFVKQVLETKPLQRLGDWSFSIYMVHVPLIFAFLTLKLSEYPKMLSSWEAFFGTQHAYAPTFADAWLLCFGLLLTTVLVASLTYRFVEVPARNYLNTRFQNSKSRESIPVSL